MSIKLNLGAGPIWSAANWVTLDHKLKYNTTTAIAGNGLDIDLPDESCEIVFCSHVFEHIPHVHLPLVLAEINRILKPDGILRILTPDLAKVAKAYVEKDDNFFRMAKEEDESLREDLGYGGMLMNFIISPGQDTALFDRSLNKFIAGYAHLYSYDYDMLKIMMTKLGYSPRRADFCDSVMDEMKVPLHVEGLDPIWNNLNQEFYKKNNLTHKLIDGRYHINFNVTGFDRDPITSLIIEAKKRETVGKESAHKIFNSSETNYNRYAWSLLKDDDFSRKLDSLGIKDG